MSASIDSNDTFPLANHFIFDQTKGVRDAIIDAFSRFVLPFGPNSSDVGANSQRSRYQCCISSYFHRTEGRGKNCVVEAFRRDYFFAYPEDYSRQSIEWVEGRFDRRPHKPAFEVIYVYSQNEGTLDLSFRGSHKAPFRGTPDVFYLGADQHVHLLYFNGAWYTSDVTAATGAPNAAPGSALTDLLDTVHQTPDVFYLGADQHVHLLYFNGAWHTTDVTTATGALNAAAGSALSGLQDTFRGTPDVFYLGTDQHVHLLYFNGAWYTSDVTAATGAPNAAPVSALTSLFDTISGRNTPDVFYLGADGHVHLLYFNGAWYTSDVTTATGAPNAAPGSALTDLLDTVYQTPDVFYLGADGHVHLLYFNGAWYTSDVTAAAGGPPA